VHITKRGEPLPINQALNRPRAKLGLELSTWMVIVFVTVTVFLVGFRLLAIISFPTLAGGAWLIVRNHPPRIPSSTRGHASGLSGALRLGALLLRLRHPTTQRTRAGDPGLRRPAGYGFHLRWTLRKCRAWHLGAGPSRSASPGVTRAGYGKFNETEITTMYQNKVTLIGFLGNDAEVRSNDNRSFTTLSLATKSSYKKDGQYISHTEWHRCVVFGKLSEFAGTLKKGAHLQVEGELRSREYETKKVGKKPALKKTIWEIRVNSILKLDRAEKASADEQESVDQAPEEAAA